MDAILKIDKLIKEVEKVREKGSLYEEERTRLSSEIIGIIRAVFGEKREGEYLTDINKGVPSREKGPTSVISETSYNLKCRQMIEFLIIMREEIRAREAFSSIQEPNFDKIEKSVEKHKLESERRKNVAEFKYWGFAIELIDTVRRELKEFRQVQESLLKSINDLRKELKESKEQEVKSTTA